MLVLFETPAGYALFKVNDEKKLKKVDDLFCEFESPEKANSLYVETVKPSATMSVDGRPPIAATCRPPRRDIAAGPGCKRGPFRGNRCAIPSRIVWCDVARFLP